MKEKAIEWIGSSKKDLRSLSEDVINEIGYALYQAQIGSQMVQMLLKFSQMIKLALIEQFTLSASSKQYLYCLFFKKNRKAALLHQKKILNL